MYDHKAINRVLRLLKLYEDKITKVARETGIKVRTITEWKRKRDLEEYDRRYSELTTRYEELEIKQKELINKRDDKKARVYIMNEFLSNLKHAKDKMTEWNDSFFTMMVESGTVHRDETITFKLKNGKEIKS